MPLKIVPVSALSCLQCKLSGQLCSSSDGGSISEIDEDSKRRSLFSRVFLPSSNTAVIRPSILQPAI
jgi:hypothetical protein